MKKAISLHIGLNYVDPEHYAGWDGQLTAAEFDSADMHLIAKAEGFEAKLLQRSDATMAAVKNEIGKVAQKLVAGDIFMVTYSGHGGQVPDIGNDEADLLDETWCLYDGQLIDDEIESLWASFEKGVRILIFSDSCHSGTIAKSMLNLELLKTALRPKFMPREIAISTYLKNRDRYLKENHSIPKAEVKASVKLISGCQDNQYSYDGTFNGQFTARLKSVWNGGKFNGNYKDFHQKICDGMPGNQTPNHYNTGVIDSIFNAQRPFQI